MKVQVGAAKNLHARKVCYTKVIMVLANAPKRRVTAHDKKRHGHHHKHGKVYTKTYWPYLPIAIIVALGWFGVILMQQSPLDTFATVNHLATGAPSLFVNHPALALAITGVASISSLLFLAKHSRLWYRTLRYGEEFIIHNPLLDIALVSVGMIGFVFIAAS